MGMIENLKSDALRELSSPMTNGDNLKPAYQIPPEHRPRKSVGVGEDDKKDNYIIPEPQPLGSEWDYARILKQHNLDPDQWRVTSYRESTWQTYDKSWLESRRLSVAPIPQEMRSFFHDPGLDAWALGRKIADKGALTLEEGEYGVIGIYADPQWGGTGSGGGSNETTERIAALFARVEAWIDMKKKDPQYKGKLEKGLLADAGDGTEGFGNVASQHQMNDLSITSQFRAYRRSQMKFIDLWARKFKEVDVAVCGSNHCEVRAANGKLASTVNDDWGVEATVVNYDIIRDNPSFKHVKLHVPDDGSADVAFDWMDTFIGLTHGHEAKSSDRIENWIGSQKSSDQAIGFAQILIHGHFHHNIQRAIGSIINKFGKRITRWQIGAPTMDNGSDWLTRMNGKQSVPGFKVLIVARGGEIVEEKTFFAPM